MHAVQYTALSVCLFGRRRACVLVVVVVYCCMHACVVVVVLHVYAYFNALYVTDQLRSPRSLSLSVCLSDLPVHCSGRPYTAACMQYRSALGVCV